MRQRCSVRPMSRKVLVSMRVMSWRAAIASSVGVDTVAGMSRIISFGDVSGAGRRQIEAAAQRLARWSGRRTAAEPPPSPPLRPADASGPAADLPLRERRVRMAAWRRTVAECRDRIGEHLRLDRPADDADDHPPRMYQHGYPVSSPGCGGGLGCGQAARTAFDVANLGVALVHGRCGGHGHGQQHAQQRRPGRLHRLPPRADRRAHYCPRGRSLRSPTTRVSSPLGHKKLAPDRTCCEAMAKFCFRPPPGRTARFALHFGVLHRFVQGHEVGQGESMVVRESRGSRGDPMHGTAGAASAAVSFSWWRPAMR